MSCSGQNMLAGRGVVVSGGSRGIGRAIAERLGDLGAGVVVNGRDPQAVEETVAAISASGGRATGVVGAADQEDVARALVDECVSTFGRLDTLINCAGIAEPPASSILTISPQEFDALIDAHLGTVFHACRAAAPVLAQQRHGAIINTSSVAFLGDYGGTGYPAGKGAVNGLTKSDKGHCRRTETLRRAGQRGVSGRSHEALHGRRVRKAHRGPLPPRVAR